MTQLDCSVDTIEADVVPIGRRGGRSMASSAEEDEENGPVATIATDSNATKTVRYTTHPLR